MATCYKCGAPHANYRRTTYTGFSTGSWWSKSSYGSGSRTYHGVRSVCEDCARSIDRWSRVKTIFWIAVIALAVFYFFIRPSLGTSLFHSTATARIISTKGLKLRERPSSDATVLLTVPNNERVIIIDKDGISETVSGKTANWYKVDYNGTTGWLWSGHLEYNNKVVHPIDQE